MIALCCAQTVVLAEGNQENKKVTYVYLFSNVCCMKTGIEAEGREEGSIAVLI